MNAIDYKKFLKEKGYVFDKSDNTYYPPNSARGKELIENGINTRDNNKSRSQRLKTAWIDDTLNIKNRDTRLDMFTALIRQQTGLIVWPEFRFLLPPLPDYRFDYAIPITQDNIILKIAIEVDGGTYARGNSGHSSPTGIARDMDKSTQASLHGWTLIRIIPSHLNTIATLDKIRQAAALRGVSL